MVARCVFCRIAQGESEARIVYQDDVITAFEDVAPQAPAHILIIPNRHIGSLNETSEDDHDLLGAMLLVARQVAEQAGLASSGYRLVINTGRDGGQSVAHLHLHVLGGRRMHWPPG